MAFPTLVRRGTWRSASSNASGNLTPTWTWQTNTAISAGDAVRWYVLVSSDGSNTITDAGGGWGTAIFPSFADGTGACTMTVFCQDTTAAFAASAAPSFTFNSVNSEQFTAEVWAYKAPTAGKVIRHLLSTTASGSSTNANPPSITNATGASQDVTSLVFGTWDSTTVSSAPPTNYANHDAWASGGTGGASSAGTDRQVTLADAASEDPGTFTSSSDQWCSVTIGVYEGVAAQNLSPELFANTQSFFSPTVSPGPVELSPSLHSDGDTFFTPTVAVIGGSQNLTPALFTNGNSFFAPIVSASYTLAPALFSDGDTFFGATITTKNTLNPAIYSNSQTFYVPTVAATYALSPPLYVDPDTFFAPAVTTSYALTAPPYVNGQAFYAPSVTSLKTIAPALFMDPDTFFTPIVTRASVGGAKPRVVAMFFR